MRKRQKNIKLRRAIRIPCPGAEAVAIDVIDEDDETDEKADELGEGGSPA